MLGAFLLGVLFGLVAGYYVAAHAMGQMVASKFEKHEADVEERLKKYETEIVTKYQEVKKVL